MSVFLTVNGSGHFLPRLSLLRSLSSLALSMSSIVPLTDHPGTLLTTVIFCHSLDIFLQKSNMYHFPKLPFLFPVRTRYRIIFQGKLLLSAGVLLDPFARDHHSWACGLFAFPPRGRGQGNILGSSPEYPDTPPTQM